MLTLEELKKMVDDPVDGAKLPTAKQLKETGISVINKKIDADTEIVVYQEGYALYRVGKYSTVFSIHLCGDYVYICDGNIVQLPGHFFEKEIWHLRLILEGEDRLSRNQEERERNISYDHVSKEWGIAEDLRESALERLVTRETVEEIFRVLTERQKAVVVEYCLYGKTQVQISKELGISHIAVRDLIFRAFNKIRQMYPLTGCQYDFGEECGEGR